MSRRDSGSSTSPKRPARRVRWLLTGVVFLLVLISNSGSARAHGYILRSIPQDRAVLTRAPARVQVWFSEPVEGQFSDLSLANDKGEAIPLTENGISPSNKSQLSAKLPATLPDGAYILTVRAAFSSDGHVGTDTVVFWVGQPVGDIGSQNRASQDALPAEVLWRMITLLGLNGLFGTLVLYRLVLLPAWGNPRYNAGNLPIRVMNTLNAIIWVSVVLAAAGTVLAVIQQTSALFAADAATVIRNGQWLVVLKGTQVGDVLIGRLFALILAVLLHAGAEYCRRRYPEYVLPLWSVNAVVAGLALGTVSASSHAVGSTLWPIEAVAADWVHVLANGAWIGGLVAMTLVLPVALAPLTQPAAREPVLKVVLRRFTVIGTLCVAVLVVTGIFSALLHLRQVADIPDTSYGRTLVAKGLLILPLLLLGLYHFIMSGGRTIGFIARLKLPDRIGNAAASLIVESALGIGVVIVAALLTATPPPVPPDAKGSVQIPAQMVVVDGLQVRLAIDPGVADANSYEVTITRVAASAPVMDARVTLVFSFPSLDKRAPALTLDPIGDGTYLGAGAEIDRVGDWQALLDITLKDRTEPLRAAFRWPVTSTTAASAVRQPTILNWLSLLAILVVAGVWTLPSALRAGRSAKVRMETVAMIVMAILITTILTVLGTATLSDAAKRSDTLRNPPPSVINPQLADAESLTSGKEVFQAQCATCHAAVADPNDKTKALSFSFMLSRALTRRDAELFQVFRKGLGAMPPASAQLSEVDTWNVINYLRSSAARP